MLYLEKLNTYFKIFKQLSCHFILILFLLKVGYIEADLSIQLSKKDKESLTEFFHAVLWGSEVGYVLYGEKPVCVEGYTTGHFDLTGKIMHHLSTSTTEGVRVWKKLSLPLETSKFVFLVKENVNEEGHPHSSIIFINKEAFYKAFSDNSSIFRYALGPEITANKLLKELKNTDQDFFSFLKNDKVLIGILLGFGLENALYVGRSEKIREALNLDLSKKNRFYFNGPFTFTEKSSKVAPPFQYYPIQPSLGCISLEHELSILNNKIDIASITLEDYSPKLIFGKNIHDNEHSSTTKLIKNYQDTQLKIINVLDHPQWLEKALTQFYTEPIHIVVKDDEEEDILSSHRPEDLSKIIAQAIFNLFNDEFEDKNKLLDFIEGMKEAEKRIDAHYIAPFYQGETALLPSNDPAFLTGFKIWSFYKFNDKALSLSSIIDQLKEVSRKDGSVPFTPFSHLLPYLHSQIFEKINEHEKNLALSHFQEMEKTNSNIKCLVKNRLYYQQINPGNGEPIFKNSIIQVSYTLKTIYGNIIEEYKEIGSVLDLQRAIKAFRLSFPTMKVGEKGILFIHLEWGIKDYLSHPYFSPYLIAEFTIQGLENDE